MPMDRVANMSDRVSFYIIAKKKDDDSVFSKTFTIVRQRARDYKDGQEFKAKDFLQKTLINDLTSKGYNVFSVDVVLGKYRGSRFVVSAKIKVGVKSEKDAVDLGEYLKRYHPKYKTKAFDRETKYAEYNIR